jgi:hypothetical protein
MSSPNESRAEQEARLAAAARAYMRSLPLKHFAETVTQSRQRAITVSTLGLLRERRPDFHLFNELLIQFPRPRRRQPGRVVPDNLIVLHAGPIVADLSFDLPLQPVGPFCVIDYVGPGITRKDYDANFRIYERELQVPWCLRFSTDSRTWALYRHTGSAYEQTPPNEQGRLFIPELDVEAATRDGWGRFWHRGELLLTPAELVSEINAARQRRAAAEAACRAAEERRRAAEAERHVEDERRARLAVEEELARLRAQVEQLG